MTALARITLQRRYSSELALVTAPAESEMSKLKPLCTFLLVLQNLIETMDQWEVEAIFTDGCGVDVPVLEKNMGLLLLKMFGRAESLDRWMWKRNTTVPPESGVHRVSEHFGEEK